MTTEQHTGLLSWIQQGDARHPTRACQSVSDSFIWGLGFPSSSLGFLISVAAGGGALPPLLLLPPSETGEGQPF